MEPQRARTRSGLAYSAATPSGPRGRPEIGTDVSPGVEMVEVGVGMEMQPTSPNQSPPTSTPERLPLDYQLDSEFLKIMEVLYFICMLNITLTITVTLSHIDSV